MAKSNLPPVLTVNKGDYEKAFKNVISKFISENHMEIENIREINKLMIKGLITGMQNVDFKKDVRNQYNLDALVDELWFDFSRSLSLKLRKYRTKFRRK